MINEAEKSGALKPGATNYQADLRQHRHQSGSSCSFRGYRIILTMPETMSVERPQHAEGIRR